MKKNHLFVLMTAVLLNNVAWAAYVAWDRFAWNAQYGESVMRAAQVSYMLGKEHQKPEAWKIAGEEFLRLDLMTIDTHSGTWRLPTDRDFVLVIDRPAGDKEWPNVYVNKKK